MRVKMDPWRRARGTPRDCSNGWRYTSATSSAWSDASCTTSATTRTRRPGYAVLEAYLLHVRTLSTFLGTSSDRAWPDDVVADDYFRGYHEPFSPLTADDRGDIDRRLAHLTTDRLVGNASDSSGFSWRPGLDRSYWGKRVLKEFTHFLDALREDSPDRAAWFEDALSDAKRNVLPTS